MIHYHIVYHIISYSIPIYLQKHQEHQFHYILCIYKVNGGWHDCKDPENSGACNNTGGSHLSHTAVKPDSHLARIFVAKFLCIIKLIIVIG